MNAELQPTPVIPDAVADRRLQQLGELQTSLITRGVRCILARNHKLVLRYNEPGGPSGMADPQLRVFISGRQLCVTTDNYYYFWLGSRKSPVDNPAAAAAVICDSVASWSR